jgi:hypothetical protein
MNSGAMFLIMELMKDILAVVLNVSSESCGLPGVSCLRGRRGSAGMGGGLAGRWC